MKPLSVPGQFRTTVDRHGLLPRGSRVLVAVSGGADSVCLLDLLRAIAQRRDLALLGFHMNHGLRPGAIRDEVFVRQLFRKSGVELQVICSDVRAGARRRGVGLEEAGRELRYRNMTMVANRSGCDRVALGHTASDNLETMILNLVRGAGARGMAGIPVKRGRFIRPLVDAEHDNIVRYLRARGIDWVEDESNKDTRYRRNLVRSSILPVLRELNPRCSSNARRAAALLQEEDGYLDEQARAAMCAVVRGRGSRKLIDTQALDRYNVVLKRRVLRQLMPELDSEGIDGALAFCGSGTRSVILKENIRLTRKKGLVELVNRRRNAR